MDDQLFQMNLSLGANLKNRCAQCNLFHPNADHNEKHRKKQNRCCGICMAEHRSFKSMKDHYRVHRKNHMCRVCNKGFTRKDSLDTHTRVHYGLDYICEICDSGFTSRNTRRNHKWIEHCCEKLIVYGNAAYECGACYDICYSKITMLKHIQSEHRLRPSEKCLHCNFKFVNLMSKQLHMKIKH